METAQEDRAPLYATSVAVVLVWGLLAAGFGMWGILLGWLPARWVGNAISQNWGAVLLIGAYVRVIGGALLIGGVQIAAGAAIIVYRHDIISWIKSLF